MMARPRRTSPRTGADALTAREREILRLLADGYTAREAAKTLGISPRTVEAHRGHIAKKLGVRRLAHLIRFALREGLIRIRRAAVR